MKALFLVSTLILSPAVFANSWIMCGETADFEEGTVTGYELELSSENEEYSGPVGGTWNLKLKEDGEWLKANKNIVAKTDKDNVLVVTIVKARSASGPVGIRYVLTRLFDEEPVLEKYALGGFAGGTKLGTYECIAGYD